MIMRSSEIISRALLFLSGAAIIAMMLQVVIDVLLSNIAGSGVPATIEYVSYYYMIAVVFLPLAAVEHRQDYLVAELFIAEVGSWLARLQAALHLICALFVYGILIYLTARTALDAYHDGEIVMGARTILIWPARFMLPIGLTAAFLVTLATASGQLFSARQEQAVRS